MLKYFRLLPELLIIVPHDRLDLRLLNKRFFAVRIPALILDLNLAPNTSCTYLCLDSVS